MESERIARLTAAQKTCLRLVLDHVETKEIARKLGVSPVAVTERLRAARSTLGVSRSIEAARLLAAYENDPIRLVDKPDAVESSPFLAPADAASISDVSGARGGLSDGKISLREDRASYTPIPDGSAERADWPLRIPLIGGKRDDLSTWQIVCWCLIAGALLVVSFALLLKIDVEVGTTRQQLHR